MSDIPDSVLDALEAVRASGHVNMYDREGVIFLAEMDGDFDAADWLQQATPARYMAALQAMGARRASPP